MRSPPHSAIKQPHPAVRRRRQDPKHRDLPISASAHFSLSSDTAIISGRIAPRPMWWYASTISSRKSPAKLRDSWRTRPRSSREIQPLVRQRWLSLQRSNLHPRKSSEDVKCGEKNAGKRTTTTNKKRDLWRIPCSSTISSRKSPAKLFLGNFWSTQSVRERKQWRSTPAPSNFAITKLKKTAFLKATHLQNINGYFSIFLIFSSPGLKIAHTSEHHSIIERYQNIFA